MVQDFSRGARTFQYQEDGPVAFIILSRAERLNALTFDVYAELRDLFAWLPMRESVRAVVITGAGRGFCSGGDVDDIIAALLGRPMHELLAFTRMTGALIANIRALDKPVVAAVNGVAAGAGAVIALASDFRIASEQASLAFLFTRVGLAGCDMGAAYLLPRVVGLARATEILMLGDRMSAGEALRLGLFTKVVAPDQVLPEAQALATRLAGGPAFAINMTKRMLNAELDLDLVASIEAEAQAQAICMQTGDFHEAYHAIKGKRPAQFLGR
jgi:enoyl-CoA hydratase/carnithine racemase